MGIFPPYLEKKKLNVFEIHLFHAKYTFLQIHFLIYVLDKIPCNCIGIGWMLWVFLYMERIIQSSTCCPLNVQAFLHFCAHQCVFSFFECTKLLIWLLLILSLALSLSRSLWNLTILFYLHDVVSEHQLPNTNGTLGINLRPFTCLIDVEKNEGITHNCPSAFESTVQLHMNPWKEMCIKEL